MKFVCSLLLSLYIGFFFSSNNAIALDNEPASSRKTRSIFIRALPYVAGIAGLVAIPAFSYWAIKSRRKSPISDSISPNQAKQHVNLKKLGKMTFLKHLQSGASGASVHLFNDKNGNKMVLKVLKHEEGTLPNFMGNEGAVQKEIASTINGLLPSVHLHGIVDGTQLKGLWNDALSINDDGRYSIILSEYVEHDDLINAIRQKKISSDSTFRKGLVNFAKKMKVASEQYQFEHNDLSRNLIYTPSGEVRLMDTGLSGTKKNPYQGEDKGNPFMNMQHALKIASKMQRGDQWIYDPFYKKMAIENGLHTFFSAIERQGTIDFDLVEFNTILLTFPDIRARIIPQNDTNNPQLLDWSGCISALSAPDFMRSRALQ